MPAELARSTMKIYKKLLRSKIEEVTTETRCTDRSHKGGIRDRRTAWSAAQRYTNHGTMYCRHLGSGVWISHLHCYTLCMSCDCNLAVTSKNLCTPCTLVRGPSLGSSITGPKADPKVDDSCAFQNVMFSH